MAMTDSDKARELFVSLDEAFRSAGAASDWCRLGVTDEQIAAIEARLDISLPIQYKEIFRLFDGFGEVRADIRHDAEWFAGFYLDPIDRWGDEEVVQLAKEMFFDENGSVEELFADAEFTVMGPAKKLLWHPRWFALTLPSSFYSWYADFAPEPGGTEGQVVFVKSDDEKVTIKVVARDFFEFIQIIIDSVRSEPEAGW